MPAKGGRVGARGSSDVAVIGGGLIGLAAAWRAARAGLTVTVVDPAPGRGSSWAAAGMLAPVTEASYGEEQLLALNLASLARYPDFVAEVEDASGRSVGYRRSGTMLVAFDADDRAEFAELATFQRRLGLEVETLTGRECRALEPLLAPGARGQLVTGDHSVDNRRLGTALLTALERAGVAIRRVGARAVATSGSRVTGVVLHGGTSLPAGQVVLAAGCWSGRIGGLPSHLSPPVRPVKGQILRLAMSAAEPVLTHTVRGLVGGRHVYLVPRADGELVVGASVEERGFDTTVTAGVTYELLRDASTLVPAIGELGLTETWAGLRPGSPDNAPMIGPGGLERLVIATGHYRNGVALAPITADAVAALLTGGAVPAEVRPFDPGRFAASGRTSMAAAASAGRS